MYTINDFELDADMLMKVIPHHPDYKEWFMRTFPNGATSVDEVLAMLSSDSKVTIRGIEYNSNVTELLLGHKNLTDADIKEIAKCPNLTKLDITGSRYVRDLSPLAALTKLESLTIEFTSIVDLSVLSTLTSLKELNASNVQRLTNEGVKYITDLSPLAKLPHLTRLVINEANVKDISPISTMTGLTYLDLSFSEVRDLSPLAGLTNLTWLSVSSQFSNKYAVIGVEALRHLTNLTKLGIDNLLIEDVSSISGLTSLTNLGIHGGKLTDISPLSALINLTELSLGENQISDVEPLQNLKKLTYLQLSDNLISAHAGMELQKALPNCNISF